MCEEVDDVKAMPAFEKAVGPYSSAHAAGWLSRRCQLAAHGVAGTPLAERASAAPRQTSSDRHMKRPAEGGGEVEGWSSCGGRPPPSAQGRGRLAGETSVGSGNACAKGLFLRGFHRARGGPLIITDYTKLRANHCFEKNQNKSDRPLAWPATGGLTTSWGSSLFLLDVSVV